MSQLGKDLDEHFNNVMDGKTSDWFYFYEPWDPEEDDDTYNSRGFQVAFHQSLAHIRMMVAANRTGKTSGAGIEAVAMMTGEIPFSLRYPKSQVTPHARPWEDEGSDSPGYLNRIRFGFKDPKDGTWNPPRKKPDMEDPGWDKTSPCGFIVGAGIFPTEKISRRRHDQVWICTWKTTRDKRWIDFMSDLIPDQFLDTRWNENGYSVSDSVFRLTNGNEIAFITYEQGAIRAQGAEPWAVFLDEEPKERKFFTECDQRMISAGHDGWLSMTFTPLFGLSWSYNDLLKPATEGRTSDVAMFHATQYHSPYYTNEVIERRRRLYKPWEVQARVYGLFSDMQGRPYYDYAKLNGEEGVPGWVQRFRSMCTTHQFRPGGMGLHLYDLLGTAIVKKEVSPAEPEVGDRHWEMYEDELYPEAAYFIPCDTAEGAQDEEDAIDRNVAWILRAPFSTEDPEWPVIVGCMRTSMEVLNFAREVWYAAMHFNYALIVPEVRGETGATLATEIRRWPFIYKTTAIRTNTNKPKEVWGFMTAKDNRTPAFDKVGDFINAHDDPQCMRNYWLLQEAAQLVYGKNGRPDHPPRGTSDSIFSFGIGLYAYDTARNQIRCNRVYGERIRRTPQAEIPEPWERYVGRTPNRLARQLPLGAKAARVNAALRAEII